MKCYYCHHRKGKCFLSVDRMVVVLCESCANRSITIRNVSMKFDRSNTAYAQQPDSTFKIGKVGKGSEH